jgi:hypothetical protein
MNSWPDIGNHVETCYTHTFYVIYTEFCYDWSVLLWGSGDIIIIWFGQRKSGKLLFDLSWSKRFIHTSLVKLLNLVDMYMPSTVRPSEFHFGWQRGYGSMTLGESKLEWAKAYVLNQKQHHLTQTMNDWLERFDDFDDDETDSVQPSTAPRVLREAKVAYIVDIPKNDLPF